MRTYFFAAAALVLAGCSSEPEAPTETADEFADRIGGGDASSPDAAPSSSLDAPPPAPMAQLGAPKPVPTKFQGVWDFIDGNCSRDSDLRLEIGANSLQFYESMGTVNGYEQPNPDTVILNLAMEGEGERWEERTRMSLVDGGKFLVMSDVSGYGSGQGIRRKRCS
ncbi:hypothetical protein [Erythrobacter litoralis]|nr:hypothetical protein [Erythrobacter litoralis]